MAAEQLQIQVSANVSNAIKGLNDLEKGLKSTETAGVKLGSQGLPQVTKGANQANTAMINLGRTVSDAPFGFIGIANNIGPLVENFTYLRKEAGTTGGALKQLGASLAGPGGVIVGIQLVVAAVQFAQLGLSRWGASSKKAKEDTDKLKQANESLVESVTKQRLEFETLVKIAKDANQTEIARTQALKRLNEILPDTIGKLNAQNIATEQGTSVIKSYIKAVEAKATAELLSGRIAANNVQIYDLQQNSLNKISELTKEIEQNTRLRKSLEGSGRLEQEAITQRKIGNAQKEIVNIQKDTQVEIDKINKLNESLRKEYENQIPLVNTLNDKQSKTAKTTNEITDLLKKYREELAGINWDEQNRGIDGVQKRLELAGNTLRDLVVAGVKETSTAFKQINTDLERFKLDDKFTRLRKVIDTVNEGVRQQANEYRVSEDAFQKANKASLDIANKNIKILLANYEAYRAKLAQINKEQLEQTKVFADTISGGLGNAFGNLFESIANGEDAFKTLSDSVKQLVFDLIRAVIQMTLVKAIANAIAPGIGSQAAGLTNDFFIRGDRLRTLTLGR
jgi:hypothetical protein